MSRHLNAARRNVARASTLIVWNSSPSPTPSISAHLQCRLWSQPSRFRTGSPDERPCSPLRGGEDENARLHHLSRDATVGLRWPRPTVSVEPTPIQRCAPDCDGHSRLAIQPMTNESCCSDEHPVTAE
jgi:hypothetical protein